MVKALAAYLRISPTKASAALNHVFEATKHVETGTGPSYVPDLSDPAIALAYQVEMALYQHFADPFPCVIVVQDPQSQRIGLASIGVPAHETDLMLLLGRGAWKRGLRQHGPP